MPGTIAIGIAQPAALIVMLGDLGAKKVDPCATRRAQHNAGARPDAGGGKWRKAPPVSGSARESSARASRRVKATRGIRSGPVHRCGRHTGSIAIPATKRRRPLIPKTINQRGCASSSVDVDSA
ncbi:MAG: hypothetical protein M0C28_14145 [Candidatus Moduliflexus flocculans]|nr:hypothetical protein [Candidatus Moduliflexus flocculans]